MGPHSTAHPHPKRYGVLPVPWLVADGYIANYQEVLNDLPLILVTSHWVKEMYVRDGIHPDTIEVLPVMNGIKHRMVNPGGRIGKPGVLQTIYTPPNVWKKNVHLFSIK